MAEHWCSEHKEVWFRKGAMKGFAHPIKDDEGNQTYGEDEKALWCNEPKEETQAKPKPQSGQSPIRVDNSASIEAQVAVKAIVELWVAGKVTEDSQLVHTAKNWLMSKLSNWASQLVEMNPMPIETKAKIEEALEKIEPLNWEVVKPKIQKLMSSKVKGWASGAEILMRVKGLGADPESKTVQQAYESLNERGKQQFIDLIKAETPSKLIQEAERIAKEV